MGIGIVKILTFCTRYVRQMGLLCLTLIRRQHMEAIRTIAQ